MYPESVEFRAKTVKLGISHQVFGAYASGNILKPVIMIDLILRLSVVVEALGRERVP
jgi:hypothetical protein